MIIGLFEDFVYLMLIGRIFGYFIDFMVDFGQFYKEGIYGDLLEYFRTNSRRFKESVKEENFVSLSTKVELR